MNTRTKLFLTAVATLCLAAFGGAALAACGDCGGCEAGACPLTASMHIAGPTTTLEVPTNVAPFSPGANFMSLYGLARWQHAQETGEWVPRSAGCPAGAHKAATTAKKAVACVSDPFAPEANFMSGCGFGRWRHYKETGVWLSGSQICKVVHGS